jgi:PAS domain S-box-containing protein
MNLYISILSGVMSILGAAVMLFAIFKTRNLLKQVQGGNYEQRWQVLFALMIAFVPAYLTVSYIAFSGAQQTLFLITGVVFLLGAIYVFLVTRVGYLTIDELGKAVENKEVALENKSKLEHQMKMARERLKQQNIVLLHLSKTINVKGADYEQVINHITKIGAETLDVERVGLWHYSEDKTAISCFDLYEKIKNEHSKGTVLQASEFPLYFEAFEEFRMIDTDNAYLDPRTGDYSRLYLTPLGISSIIHVAVWVAGKTLGILTFEHVGPTRIWTPEEKTFARTLADMVSLAWESSQKQETEKDLRESEERYKRLSEASFEGIALHDQGKIIEVNTAFEKITGYPEKDIIGRNFLDFIAPEAQDDARAYLESKQNNALETIALRNDNTVIYTEIIQRHVEMNGLSQTVVAMRDIGWRKKTEQEKQNLIEELKKARETLETKVQERTASFKEANEALMIETENRKKMDEKFLVYEDIVNNMPVGVLMFEFEDVDDTKTLRGIMANPAAEMMGQAKAKDFIDKPWIEYSPGTFESGRDQVYQEVVKTGKIKDLGIIHYKGAHNALENRHIPENFFHFMAFPISNNSFCLSIENVTEKIKNEEKFQRVFEASQSALFMVDEEGKIILANSEAEKLYGYSKEELQKINIIKLFPQEYQGEFLEMKEQFFSPTNEASWLPVKEGRGLRKDGTMPTVNMSFNPTYSKTGIYLLVSITDITERKMAKEQIQLYKDIIENIPIGLDVMKFENIEDPKSLKVVSINPAFEKYSGIKSESLVGKYANDLPKELFKSEQGKVFQNIVKTGEAKDLGTFHHEVNGQPENYTHVKAFPIPGNHIALSYENITEQIKTEERFRLIVEAAPSAMVMTDKAGKISLVNARAQELFGYSKEELQTMDVSLLFADRYRKEYFENRQAFFESPLDREKFRKLEHIVIKKDGSEIVAEVSYIPIYSGNLLFMLTAINPFSKKKLDQKKLEENYQTFKAVVEQAPIIITRLNAESTIEYINSLGEQAFHIDNMVGMQFTDLLDETSKADFEKNLNDVFASGNTLHFDTRFKLQEGQYWYKTTLTPIKKDEKVSSVISISLRLEKIEKTST